ncbi:MAG TPA: FAD:protein FMN transferase, partial [Anaerolineales bacterium]|nr:FAD:protein FMN transferase [Anaerolineales bacterium]
MIEYDEFRAMNTTILVAAEGEREAVEPGFAQVRQFIEAAEEQFSRFRETSELTKLNRAAGQWFPVSEAMFTLLKEASEVHRRTRGLFDPTILGALKFAGYDRSMDEIRNLDTLPVHMNFFPLSPGFDYLDLDPVRRAVWMPHEMQIDLGGIAKGWIAARAAQQLAQFTEAGAVSAGGDMVLFGAKEEAWQISLEDPRDSSQVLAVLHVGPGAVATSSVMKRRWQQQHLTRHHIIDPRTGSPSTSSWLSVTVYA